MEPNFIEVDKPKSLEEANKTLYYMYANGIDTYDKKPIYREITTDEALCVAYKVYVKEGE
tara:strand:+ start:28350 stop:28529 length:180 start_codon:yes stop_codon:yes gene_type:complete